MKNKLLQKVNKITAVCLLIFGICYLYLGKDLPFGRWSAPNTGFMPRLSGIAMVVLATVNLILELRQPDEVPEELREVNWLKAYLYIGCCAVYVLMLALGLGYVPSTLICLLAMIKFTGIKGWMVPIVTTVAVTFFFYGVFNRLLGVYLPRITLF